MAAERRLLDRRRSDSPGAILPSYIERHIQTVLVSLMTAALLWLGAKVTSTSDTLIALRSEASTEISTIKAELMRLRSRMDGAYLVADSARDWQFRDRQLIQLEDRLRFLEQRMGLVSIPWAVPLELPKGPRGDLGPD